MSGLPAPSPPTRPGRVLWLTKGLGLGGTERLLANGCRHVDPSRYEVEVAYVLPWKDALVQDIEAQGIPVHCLGHHRRAGVAWIAGLRHLVRAGNFDIVHTHMPQPAVAARLALGRNGPALVHTEHNVWQRYRKPTYWSNALTYRRNSAVIAVSEAVARSIKPPRLPRQSSPCRVEVLVHGIDLGSVVPLAGPTRARARDRLGIDADELVIGTVGNFTAKKDHRTLVAAIAQLVATHPRVRLVLVGSGPLEDELRGQVERLSLGSRVLFGGSRNDVPEILPAFDVFALSSLHEGLPIALIEAMATGLPCVATRVGGVPEALEHDESGFIVPPGDPDILAVALAKLLDNPTLRATMGERGGLRGRQFELSHAVARTLEIYDEVRGGSSRR